MLYGGSFDPVHIGHLRMAEYCREALSCERVILIPLRFNPFKKSGPVAGGADRAAMLEIAVGNRKGCEVSRVELTREGPSFTYDTVKTFRERLGGEVELFWLVGADAAEELWRWQRIEQLLDLCHICVMRRGGYTLPDMTRLEEKVGKKRTQQVLADMIETPEVEICSSEIRKRLEQGRDVSGMIPEPVLSYIKDKGLYYKD